jgi:opacity protein-like surface antigen
MRSARLVVYFGILRFQIRAKTGAIRRRLPRRGDAMRRFIHLLVLCLAFAASAATVLANPSKDRWWFGASLGYHTTEASITPNAEEEFDFRPDDYISRETAIEDTISYSLSAGFGMTERFTLQVEVGWFEGEIGKIDTYLEDTFPLENPFNPAVYIDTRQTTESITAGTVTEIPVTLSGVVRFLTDGPFNPYVGAGAGMVFTQIDALDDIVALNDRLDAMRVRAVLDERGNDLTPREFFALRGSGRVPLTHPMTVEVDDAIGFHLMTGLEYFPTDRISIVADLRYTFLDQEVRIDLEGEDEVIFDHFSEVVFRDDGSVKYFRNSPSAPNPMVDPNDPTKGLVGCVANSRGDFDKDGHTDDVCYNTNLGNALGNFLVQGGEINLSGFTAQIGMRFHLP